MANGLLGAKTEESRSNQILNHMCMCVCLGEDENPRTRTSETRPMSKEQTSESTDRKSSGEYKQLTTSTKRLQCPRTLRILTCPRKDQGLVLKTIRHKPRKRRKICRQARKARMQINTHHLRIKCSKPTQLATLMRK